MGHSKTKKDNMTYEIKIYKIVNNINDDIYIGSTKNELRKRFYLHKHMAKKNPNKNGLYTLMNNNQNANFRIILMSIHNVNNKQEQLIIEQNNIDEYKPKLNNYNAYLSLDDKKTYKKEYNNRDYVKEKDRQYTKDWIERNKEYKRQYDKGMYHYNKEAKSLLKILVEIY